MTSTLEERVGHLEADAYRNQRRFDSFQSSLAHLTSAIGDLSQDQRAMALDIRELKDGQTAMAADITEIRGVLASHGVLLKAMAAKMGIEVS